VRKHREADQLVQGCGYWHDGKGCAVGGAVGGEVSSAVSGVVGSGFSSVVSSVGKDGC
jgi:hypothetical protein